MYKYAIIVNPQDGHVVSDRVVQYADNDNTKDMVMNSLQTQYPLSTICVYELKQMRKLVNTPKYANYAIQPNGEVLPV